MTSKRNAQKQAAQVRRDLKKKGIHKTVNVREISKGNFGVRTSPKGKRDTFDYRKGRYGH
jgi:hypothetical protein